MLIHTPLSPFWNGVLIGPILAVFLLLIVAWLYRHWQRFYKGTTIFSWFGMWLIYIGLKLVRPTQCKTAQLNRRFYFSPMVKQFEVPDTK